MAATAAAASTSREATGAGLLEGELKRPGQALMGRSEVGPGDSVSTREYPDSVRVRPQYASSSQPVLYGQP